MSAAIDTRPRLLDCCSPAIQLCVRLDKTLAGGDADAVRYACDDAFTGMATEAKRLGIRQEDAEQAKYALVALIDERILQSQGPVQEAWLAEPLQMKYFDEFAAGEEFFNRLDRLRADVDGKAEVLEVYHLVLSLGFCGKFADRRGAERRAALLDGLGKDLQEAYRSVPQEDEALLSANLDHLGESPSWWQSLPLWVVPAAIALVLLLTFLILTTWQSRRFDALVRSFIES